MAEQLFNGAGNLPNAGPLLSGFDLAFQNIGSEINCIHTLFHSKRIRLAISVDDNMPGAEPSPLDGICGPLSYLRFEACIGQ